MTPPGAYGAVVAQVLEKLSTSVSLSASAFICFEAPPTESTEVRLADWLDQFTAVKALTLTESSRARLSVKYAGAVPVAGVNEVMYVPPRIPFPEMKLPTYVCMSVALLLGSKLSLVVVVFLVA